MKDRKDIRFYGQLGDQLREARELMGLTQQQVADESGVPRATIAQIEVGAQRVYVRQLVNIARALGYTIDELLEGLL